MENSLFKYIWRFSKGEQLSVLGLVVCSLPFYFMSLDLPRMLVNGPIQGAGFETPGAVMVFARITLTPPEFLHWLTGSAGWVLLEGFELSRIPFLMVMSIGLLMLVAINGAFKFQINTLKGRMGERMLRRLRYQLFDHVLRFPALHMRKVRQAEVASMIKDEVESLGGFIGDAFVQPAFLGGMALTAMIFIMLQSFWLGLVAGSIVLVQAFLIPKLRQRILALGRQRQLAARQLAGRVGEVIEGALEVHAHDTSNYERADIASRLGHIFDIRYEIYRRKFFVKFLNNLLAQFTPFIFYSAGGYLAIVGLLDIGQLVAALVAYKELPGPVKELIDWDQQRMDTQIKYEEVISQFNPAGLLDAELQNPEASDALPGDRVVTASRITLEDDAGIRLIDGISFSFGMDSHIAITGAPGSGTEYLGMLLARLIPPASGRLTIGGADMSSLPQAATGRRMSYADGYSVLFARSVRENMLYGLMHRPLSYPSSEMLNTRAYRQQIMEAERSGNPNFDLRSDWIDYQAAGAQGPFDIDTHIAAALDAVMLGEDVYQLGLRGAMNMYDNPLLTENILNARKVLRDLLRDPEYAALVESFDPERFNRNATLGENLLFGTAVGATFSQGNLVENPYLKSVLDATGLTLELVRMGFTIAETMVEIFSGLPAGHPFFDQFSFIAADDLPRYEEIMARAGKLAVDRLPAADRKMLMELPFDYIEARHRLGLINANMESVLLAARRQFAANLPAEYRGAIEFYDPEKYNSSATLVDNILFGRLLYGQVESQARIGSLINEIVSELNLRWEIFKVGLNFNVGASGRHLSSAQRQKLALARAILKRPDILIANDALDSLDARSQQAVLDKMKEFFAGRGLVWIVSQPILAKEFDRILVIEDGKIAEQGHFDALSKNGARFAKLLAAS